jgi:cell pole-organizing protein PopZ
VAAAAPPAPEPFEIDEGDDDDVLELTDPEPAPAAPAPVAPARAPEPEPFAAVETLGDIDIAPRAAPRAPEPVYAPRSIHDEDGLTAPPTADAAASIFGQLSRTLAMPAEHRTLEDVVRELLRPMLKDWLDRNLPSIVETAVQAEVERIARRRL